MYLATACGIAGEVYPELVKESPLQRFELFSASKNINNETIL
jgi:hypothetical protein